MMDVVTIVRSHSSFFILHSSFPYENISIKLRKFVN